MSGCYGREKHGQNGEGPGQHQFLRETSQSEAGAAEGCQVRLPPLPEEDTGGHLYLIICIQGLKGFLFDEFFHFFHIQDFYPVVEVPKPQDHTVRTEHKGNRV